MPAALTDKLRAILSEPGQRTVPPARPAATVAVIRDAPAGLEVLLLTRVRTMAFAGGMQAFPGGAVDPEDGDVESDLQLALRNAAVRETREECAIELAPADLWPIAHWVTPEVEPRRFDTWFYVTRLPDGAEARINSESDSSRWWSPAEAVASHRAGGLPMLPPTLAVLLQLSEYADVSAALADAPARRQPAIMPEPRLDGDVITWVLVDAYSGEEIELP